MSDLDQIRQRIARDLGNAVKPADIVELLGALEAPVDQNNGCRLCDTYTAGQESSHEYWCPWLLARRFVAAVVIETAALDSHPDEQHLALRSVHDAG